MSTAVPGEQPLDLAALTVDALLLDALGRGDPAPPSDQTAAMLAAWRDDLAGDPPVAGDDADLVRIVTGGRAEAGRAAHPPADDAEPVFGPQRIGRFTRLVLGAAAAVIAVAGLTIGANHAGPGSPLWPLTEVMYPQQADARAAEHAIGSARTAVSAGHYDQARQLLDEAAAHVARVRDPEVARRLRADIDAVRRDLVTAPSLPANPGPGASMPATPPSPPASARAGSGNASPSGPPAQGGQLPNLPPAGTPVLPLPLPPALLPSVPSLPLPTSELL